MSTVLDDERWRGLLDVRVDDPGAVAQAYARRARRRRLVGESGRLFLVAADHPARGSLRVGDDPLAMAGRRDLLAHVLTALEHPDVDGVVAAPDVVEDLLLLGALEHRVVFGSMNRGGLEGADWTLDDRFTAYDADTIARCRLDGGKMLLRLDDGDPATATTLAACAAAVTALAGHRLTALVEPLPFRTGTDGGRVPLTDTASLARALAVASGLGTTSAHTWLKTPAAAEPEAVYAATSLPCLVLGGAVGPDAGAQRASWRAALRQPVVRGLVLGRSVLYPADGDVAAAVAAAADALREVA